MKKYMFRIKTILIVCFLFIKLPAQNNIIIPDTLQGSIFNLTIQNGSFQFLPNTNSATMGINGPVLGPTLIMNKNEFVNIYLDNQLGEATTIHWHGMHVSAENDGGPHTVINAGEIWNPQFTVLDKAGTYWYHPHLHENTNRHVSKGIAGFIIVKDDEEAALNLPRSYGVDDFPLAIQTKTISATGQIIVPSNADTVLMVNATVNPQLDVPGQVVRLRLLNGSSMRAFNLGFTGNQNFHLIATDGGLLSASVQLTRLMLSPGERAEILFDFLQVVDTTISLKSFASELPNGIYGAAQAGMMPMQTLNGYSPNPMNGADFDVIHFNIQNQTINPITIIPTNLVTLNPYPVGTADTTRTFFLTPETMGPNMLNGNFHINGVFFNMGIINEIIQLNNTEIWSITNQSPIAHPFHIHDVQFFILDRNGSTPGPTEQGRKDVILINPMETVRFITKFEDFANDSVPYMYHCHMLIHEDAGMMGQFIVVDESVTGIDEISLVNENFELKQAYPNPFNPMTTIEFEINKDSQVLLTIYNVLGQKLFDLVNETMPSGVHKIQFDATTLPSGTYFYELKVENQSIVKRMSLLK